MAENEQSQQKKQPPITQENPPQQKAVDPKTAVEIPRSKSNETGPKKKV